MVGRRLRRRRPARTWRRRTQTSRVAGTIDIDVYLGTGTLSGTGAFVKDHYTYQQGGIWSSMYWFAADFNQDGLTADFGEGLRRQRRDRHRHAPAAVAVAFFREQDRQYRRNRVGARPGRPSSPALARRRPYGLCSRASRHVSGAPSSATLLPLAAFKLVVQLSFVTAYGYFRDELYYLACARHLAWGYVDHPPLGGRPGCRHRRLRGLAPRDTMDPRGRGRRHRAARRVARRRARGERRAQWLAQLAVLFALRIPGPRSLLFDERPSICSRGRRRLLPRVAPILRAPQEAIAAQRWRAP